MSIMISAVYAQDGVNWNFTLDGPGSGMTGPSRARYDVYEEMRVQDGITIQPYVGPTALENWVEEMARSDAILPRWGEDILDGMDKSGVAQITLARLQSKKELRATKP